MTRDASDSSLEGHRSRLLRMVRVRMDHRLRRRMDASDVAQEVLLEARRREGRGRGDVPTAVWLRQLADQKIAELWRRHVGAARRDVRREEGGGALSARRISEIALAPAASPESCVAAREQRAALAEALRRLGPVDREILVLRHFDQLTNAEAAAALDVPVKTASKRYVRALDRLRSLLSTGSGRA